MNPTQENNLSKTYVLELVNKIFNNVFNKNNPYSLDELLEKFAFDIKLPQAVKDSETNEPTWADSTNSDKYITMQNMEARDSTQGWILPKREIGSLQEMIELWQTVNYTTTERTFDSVNVAESDTIYGCENIYRSTNCFDSKNLIYCDSCSNCESVLASQRSGTSNFCIRTDDSKDCSNSYSVIYSSKVINSLFIQDCFDLYECMFCAHIASKRFCIANMQFDEAEYYEIKKMVVEWVLS